MTPCSLTAKLSKAIYWGLQNTTHFAEEPWRVHNMNNFCFIFITIFRYFSPIPPPPKKTRCWSLHLFLLPGPVLSQGLLLGSWLSVYDVEAFLHFTIFAALHKLVTAFYFKLLTYFLISNVICFITSTNGPDSLTLTPQFALSALYRRQNLNYTPFSFDV